MPAILKRALIGIQRRRVRVVVESGVAFAALWTLVDATQSFLQFQFGGWPRYVAFIVLSVVAGVWRAVPPDSRTVRIPGSNSRLTVTYADLFAEKGIIAVPVNDFFDCLVGAHVAPHSVHGQTITKVFGGDSMAFQTAVVRALSGVPFERIPRKSGCEHRYPLGTVAYLQTGQPSVLAFALTTTDLGSLKVSANVPQMWLALAGLWNGARIHCNDRPLSVPLVGGGLSGVGLSPQHLLSLIVTSATAEMRRDRICADIRICLREDVRSETDIDAALALIH